MISAQMSRACSQACSCSPVIRRIAWHADRRMKGIHMLQVVQLQARAWGTDVTSRWTCAGREWTPGGTGLVGRGWLYGGC